ncbi:MAG: hypothetical protein QY332_14660 [Anaerolineales bacterium]|nr:MAG: hypothetical protein QY332_14660 [Anaerolineales bacterium]
MKTTQDKKREACRRGGLVTLARHGRKHFANIGRRGAAVFWRLYKFVPAGRSDFAVVKIETGVIVAYLSGRKPS